MSEHELRDPVNPGVWTPRFIFAGAVFMSSRGPTDYLVYRNLTPADGLGAGDIACTCPGFRLKQLRGLTPLCKHVTKYREESA